ncbi:protein-disulfide reductase DsbD domain-containing protein [Pedobacter panaciterrae]|jgi:Disulphide bond corrector protein DsbC.|uniref:Protein-disulfide reductase DsbD domain-containing protein n=1 Tax=Pedobacter panaciterrae TaxID=363849 RepID=A0ABU8NFL3_9SPHI|nr:protein-disulfide reductase DsbD domain-containing protein [Pedobacter panaciterrae]NQX56709.1 sugar transporter [Pedobacter panaciterrae]
MKNLFVFALALFLSFSASSQILKPVKWSYAAKKTSKTEAILYLKATIEDRWHIYSQNMADGGPVKTSFSFVPSKTYKLSGKTVEPKAITKFEKSFEMNVSYFEKSVIFQQKIKLTGAKALVKGTLEFMVCDDQQCLPPETVEFSIPVS